jgi:hypothetical protein
MNEMTEIFFVMEPPAATKAPTETPARLRATIAARLSPTSLITNLGYSEF